MKETVEYILNFFFPGEGYWWLNWILLGILISAWRLTGDKHIEIK